VSGPAARTTVNARAARAAAVMAPASAPATRRAARMGPASASAAAAAIAPAGGPGTAACDGQLDRLADAGTGPAGWHGAVRAFKRRLLETALLEAGGNRTHAAQALGLERTYLLRLIRDLGVGVPAPPRGGRGR
jgi:DNA-binding NtrC family response regulator